MRVGETISKTTVETIASQGEMGSGVIRLKHPRCGRVVIRRQPSGTWRVEECERPDKAKKGEH